MSLPVIVRPTAEGDVRDIFAYLEQVREGLGRTFIDRLRDVLEKIESMPEMFGVVWRDVRAVRLRRFQYVVYYSVFHDRVEILAVIHGARDDAIWRSRVADDK